MATNCCVCGKKIGFLDTAIELIPNNVTHVLCQNCHFERLKLKSATGTVYQKFRVQFQPLIDSPSTPREIKDYFLDMDKAASERANTAARAAAAASEKEAQIRQNLEHMILTTGSNFEGYRIVKYLDVLCEEVVFKNSFMNQLCASIEDFGSSLTFRETEMSGSTDLIARARDHVMKKFRARAAQLGANAVLGVDFESSVGADIVRVAIFGTAVVIEPVADFTIDNASATPEAPK